MAADYSGTADLSGAVATFYGKSFLERLLPQVVMMNYCEKASLPEGEGTIVYWPRMTTPSTTVSAARIQYSAGREPISPGNIVSTAVSATIEKYGYAVAVQDVTKLTAISSTMTEVTNNMADQAAQVIDTRIIEEAYGSSSNAVPQSLHFSAYAYNTAAATEVTGTYSAYYTWLDAASHRMTAATVRGAVKKLKKRNVLPQNDGFYTLICHSDSAMQLQADTTWQAAYYMKVLVRFVGNYIKKIYLNSGNILRDNPDPSQTGGSNDYEQTTILGSYNRNDFGRRLFNYITTTAEKFCFANKSFYQTARIFTI